MAGTEIDTNDILAYFVWIPRYAYQIWDDNATDTASSSQEIKIRWESGDLEYTNGLNVGEYRTHPAFWWDNDGDRVIDSGETLSGIWVGKFETTQGTSSNVGTSYPTILPGISPWFLRGARYDDVGDFRYVGLDGAAGTDAGFRTVLVP